MSQRIQIFDTNSSRWRASARLSVEDGRKIVIAKELESLGG